MSKLKKFVVCGSGMMGAAIAQVLAGIDGADVTILRSSHRGGDPRDKVRTNMKQLVEHGVVTPEYVDEIVSKISIAYDKTEDKVRESELIIECVPEVLEIKQDLFAGLEDVVSEKTIFCTNTSAMRPTDIGAKCKHRERVCGTHFWNPAFLIPLVEVVKTEFTSDEVIDNVMEVMKEAGKEPCLCKKDVPGFIANRLQHALWREAISMVENGIADAETVDRACKNSFGLRLPYLPPLVNSDMVGTQLTYNIHSTVLQDLEDSHEPSPLLSQMIEEGKLGFKAEKKDGYREGFMKYTDEEIAEINEGLNTYLIKMLYNK